LKRAFIAISLAFSLALAGCAADGDIVGVPGDESSAPPTESDTLTVVVYDSFDLSDETKALFAEQTGLQVEYISPGNAGTIVNQLVLTKDSPIGDVVYGIDNTFAGRAIGEDVLSPYDSPALPAESRAKYTADEGGTRVSLLTPIDYGVVCVNADKAWFAERALAIPETLEDLAKPEYQDTLVVPNAASSSPGLAFMLATIGAFGDGDGWLDYWKSLKANGVKVAADWTEAYTVDFSGSSGQGSYPLVVSYNTSPASEIGDDGQPTTSVLTQTCFRQVEYAGVIKGAQNEVGARKWIDFMLSQQVQAEIPDYMWTYPVIPDVPVPADWTSFAPVIDSPWSVPAAEISANREDWIKQWTDVVVG
jgi:thiamine transport system substrate-binding protein